MSGMDYGSLNLINYERADRSNHTQLPLQFPSSAPLIFPLIATKKCKFLGGISRRGKIFPLSFEDMQMSRFFGTQSPRSLRSVWRRAAPSGHFHDPFSRPVYYHQDKY